MTRPTLSVIGLAIAAVLSANAQAQQADAGATTLDTVIVTGTRASDRTVLESTVPVDVLTAEDIRKAGVVNGELGSALQALLPSFNFPRQSNSGGADHIRAAQLRGLSPDQVLVLVNGKRRHTSALVNTDSKIGKGTTPVDFNSIPINAIKRIEVLRDGAGAQYGSDAIAGVINVILDDNPERGELEASFGAYNTDVKPIDRRVTDGQTSYASAKVGTLLGDDGGFFKVGLELKNREATNRAGFDQIPSFEEQTPANLALRGQRNYVLGDGATKGLNAWLNTKVPFSASGEFYAFGTYNQRDTEGANYFRYPDGSANWREIYPNGYRPISEGENRDLQLVAGARGQWGSWDYDASVNYGRNDFTYRLRNSLNASLGPGSPTRFKTGDFAFVQTVGNIDLTRVFDAAGATHTFGTGAEFRREQYRTHAGDPASYAAGPFTDRPTGSQAGGGLTPQDEADLSRNVASAYANVSSQFGDKFSTDLAGRYEHYQDFGSQWTGKLAARYAFAPAFALRGAISNNVRAPSLSQIGYEATSTGYDAAGRLTQGRLLSVNNPIARGLGATDLKPEKSVNYSLGFTSKLGDHFDVSLDFFQIDIDDRIALSENITGDALTSFVQQNYGVTGVQSASYFLNAADTRTRGAELVANWRQYAFGGDLLLTGTYSYAKTELENIIATPAQLLALNPEYVLFGVEESNTLTDAAPRTRASLAANWSNERWNLQTRVNRYGSATRVFDFGGGFVPRQTYGAEWQLDLEAEYHLGTQWTLAIGGQNILDNYSDRSIDDIAYFGNLPYDVLSPIGSNGAYWYGRVRYSF
ncbi:TonB-dependent receptor plug domain-containing protein [Xanthomonas euvesicatoria]|uniref:TonB-dependent receptor plug domain-containing protein n=1 Tax=Xanthomonas euvesicatoria TaxID=456327 RepID=UPI000F8F41C7|nr:TonB-dependent receptor [Xanthomonas euvesicatoria]